MGDVTVYHGTNCDFDAIDLSRSRQHRDFGGGFYTTTLREQACAWARNMSARYGGGKFVKKYRFQLADGLRVKRFAGMDEEWLEFVKANRTGEGSRHHYDIVEGPVANDNTMRTIYLYVDGIITADEALRRLAYFKVNDQISFHTAAALKCLSAQGTEVVDG